MNPRRRPAFMLVEVLAFALLGLALTGIVFVTLNDAIRAQRRAQQRLDRLAAVDALHARLAADVLQGSGYTWHAGELTLEAVGEAAPGPVTYRVEPDAVLRLQAGRVTHRWACRRLHFDARVERGPRGGLFVLELCEEPPPGSRRVRATLRRITFVLPPGPVREARP